MSGPASRTAWSSKDRTPTEWETVSKYSDPSRASFHAIYSTASDGLGSTDSTSDEELGSDDFIEVSSDVPNVSMPIDGDQ